MEDSSSQGNGSLGLGAHLLQSTFSSLPSLSHQHSPLVAPTANPAASNSFLSVGSAASETHDTTHSALPEQSNAEAGDEISAAGAAASRSDSSQASATSQQQHGDEEQSHAHNDDNALAESSGGDAPPSPRQGSTAKVVPQLQVGTGSRSPHNSSSYSLGQPGGRRELTGATSFSLEMLTPSLQHTASFGGGGYSAGASPQMAGGDFSSPQHARGSIPVSARSDITTYTDIDDSVSSPYSPQDEGVAFLPGVKKEGHPDATGASKATGAQGVLAAGGQHADDDVAGATAPRAYPAPSPTAGPLPDEAGGVRGGPVHVVHLEDSDDDEEGGMHDDTGRPREPLKFCDYAGCLSLGLLSSIGAGILWSRTVKGGQVEDNELLRWSIAATVVAVLTGYCVWLCVMTSKFEALQAEWDEVEGGDEGVEGGGTARGPPTVFNFKQDCKNPAVGTCKLLVLLVGGAVMLPLFVIPYLLSKGALRGCRCCCQHCFVPCLEGFFSCVGRIVDGCVVPCCRGIARAGRFVWQNLCVPVYTHVVRPVFLGAWNTLVWIFNNVVVPVARFVYDSVACLLNALRQLCVCLYEQVLLPVGRGIAAAWRCVLDHVLRPLWAGVCAACSCVYNNALLPAARCVRDYVFLPVWRGVQCFYNTVLVNMWRYLVMWPLQRLLECMRWICGTCLPAIGRALYCAFDAVVLQPLRWMWRNAVSPLLHYMFVVPWRHVLLPVLRALGRAAAAIGGAIAAAAAAVGRFFSSVGRALAGPRRR